MLSSGLLVALAAGPELPNLVITEIVADNAASDAFEYIEIYNASGKTINLYDYSIAYVSDLTSASYNGPNKKTQLVPGNFSTSLVDTSRAFANPAECNIPPGGIAVVWFWNFDSYAAQAKLGDFRAYYGLGEETLVVAVDADNSAATGNPDRFNLPNSGYRGLCIVRDGFVLNAGYDQVICMATLDYGVIQPSMPDLAVVYGKSTKTDEPWRLSMSAYWVEPTPGRLTEAQQLEFGVGSDPGTSSPTGDLLPKALLGALALPVILVLPRARKAKKYKAAK